MQQPTSAFRIIVRRIHFSVDGILLEITPMSISDFVVSSPGVVVVGDAAEIMDHRLVKATRELDVSNACGFISSSTAGVATMANVVRCNFGSFHEGGGMLMLKAVSIGSVRLLAERAGIASETNLQSLHCQISSMSLTRFPSAHTLALLSCDDR